MKKNKSIKLKAAFLLTVFALNTVVGFACAVGADMGFNSKHHIDEEKAEAVVHVHGDGKKHIHQEKSNPGKSQHSTEDATKVVVHVHANGKKHLHKEKTDAGKLHHNVKETTKAIVHVHPNGKKHVHQKKASNQGQDKSSHDEEAGIETKGNEGNDNCCTGKVMRFEQLDKSVVATFSYVSPVFYTAFLSTYYYKDVLYSFEGSTTTKYFVRSYHPPIPDIRIAIQSFQI